MTNILPQSGRDSALALTDFPHVPGVITAEQREHLAVVAQKMPHWFCWHHNCGDAGREGRAPLNPGRVRSEGLKPGPVQGVSAANPQETAGALAAALSLIPIVDGVGCALKSADPDVVVLDLDHVRHPVTGELNAIGVGALHHLTGVYVEVSPSGSGLRAVFTGVVSFEAKKFFPLDQSGKRIIGPDGVESAIEIFRAGKGLWTRMTGAMVAGVGLAQWGECAPVLDWIKNLLEGSKNPDNVGGQGTGSNVVPMRASADSMTVDQVLDRLERYRGDWSKSAEEVEAALKLTAKRSPTGKIAEALSLMAKPGKRPGPDNKDWADSDHDFKILCEAFRRGIDSAESAMELLESLSVRDKVKREDYRRYTAKKAALEVLEEVEKPGFDRRGFRGWEHLPDNGIGSGADRAPAPLPEGMADALTVSGEQLVYVRGRVAATPGNVKALLVSDPLVRGLLAFNESTQDVEKTGSFRVFDQHASDKRGNLQDVDISFIQAWAHRAYGVNLKKGEVMQAIEMASRANSYDPLRDSLLKLGEQWDHVPRLRTWLRDHAMIDDTGCPEYVAEVGVCFMVGAVSRALNPGCKFDTVLTLEGPTGGGKSTLFQVLADAVGPDLFTDGVSDVTNAVHRVEATEGKFIAEMPELAGFRKTTDQEALKTVLSQVTDRVRKPYAMRPVQILRRFVFTGTTNLSQYLADPSGALARRFWPVLSTATEDNPIDMASFRAVAPQLWGEAVHLFHEGNQKIFIEPGSVAWKEWRLERDQRQEDLRFEEEVNQLMVNIAGGIMGPKGADIKPVTGYRGSEGKQPGITARDAALAMGLDPDKVKEGKYSEAVGKTLRAKGFERLDKSNGAYRWHMPPDLLQAAARMRKERAKETGI